MTAGAIAEARTERHRPPVPGAALAAALLGLFVLTLDALIVNVALPAMGRDIGGGLTGAQWVVDGYTLVFAALLLSAGSLVDRIGARQAFAAGFAVFVAASAACALAPDMPVLVAARLVQGAGAAIIAPSSLALVREAYPDAAKRTRAVALWALGGSLGSAAGPLLGGALTQLNWRMIFIVNVPVGVTALVLLSRTEPSPRRPSPLDPVGQAAAVAALAGITYGLIEAGASGLASPRVWVPLGLGVAAFAVFVVAQARGRHPSVPASLVRSQGVAVPFAVGFALNVAFYGMVFLLSLYFQQVRGLSTMETAWIFLPMTAATGVMSVTAGRVTARTGARLPVILGQVIMVVGLLLVVLAPASTPTALMAALMTPVAIGGALALPALAALLLDSVPADRVGVASAVLNTCRQTGGTLGVAVFGALVSTPHGFLHGVRISLLSAAVLLAATTAATTRLPGGRRPVGAR
jgi:MFS transporter, DHA2 family, methylenomycin A resistance protein